MIKRPSAPEPSRRAHPTPPCSSSPPCGLWVQKMPGVAWAPHAAVKPHAAAANAVADAIHELVTTASLRSVGLQNANDTRVGFNLSSAPLHTHCSVLVDWPPSSHQRKGAMP